MNSNLCLNAIQSARSYLISCIENDRFYDQWKGTTIAPPVEHSASPMLCFFSVLALSKCGGIPETVKKKVISILYSAKKGDAYGYDKVAPIDSDDTAFALRTLILLGEKITADQVTNALSPFKTNESWFTFASPYSKQNPVFHYEYKDPSSVFGPHPEVHLNILALYQDIGVEINKIHSLPEMNSGLLCSYFYNSAFYASWIFSTLCEMIDFEYLPIKNAILKSKMNSGGWSGRENGFSTIQETSLALLTLDTFSMSRDYRAESVNYIAMQQKENGSFPGGILWSHRLPEAHSNPYWFAEDIMSIVSTSFAILALS